MIVLKLDTVNMNYKKILKMKLKAGNKLKCVEVLVKFFLKTSNNFEAVIKLEIDISVRFLLTSSRPHSSQQSQALC